MLDVDEKTELKIMECFMIGVVVIMTIAMLFIVFQLSYATTTYALEMLF